MCSYGKRECLCFYNFHFGNLKLFFRQSPFFVADGIAWAFALSLVTLCLAIIITAVARENFPNPLGWIGVLVITAFGVLAVTADNPLTLVLIWAAIDLVELISQMRFVEDPKLSERMVAAFASRVTGTLILLWASMVSASNGLTLDFRSAPPQAGLYLVAAAAFRLGVLPLHLPYASKSSIRRGLWHRLAHDLGRFKFDSSHANSIGECRISNHALLNDVRFDCRPLWRMDVDAFAGRINRASFLVDRLGFTGGSRGFARKPNRCNGMELRVDSIRLGIIPFLGTKQMD